MIKKMPLDALVLLAIFLAFFLGIYFLSNYQEYKTEREKKYDGRPEHLPSPTPYPRLADTDREARVWKLFQTNGGCRFPCWWGIVPGETSWEAAHAFFTPFLNSGTQQYRADITHEITTVGEYYHALDFNIEFVAGDGFPVSNILISDIPLEYLSSLTIRQVFQTYGAPGEIYIRSPYREIGDNSCVGEFQMFLYYPSTGFAVRYRYQWYALKQTIRVCGLDRPVTADFYVWAPSPDADFQKLAGPARWDPSPEIVRIEEATDWTSASFYAAFQSETGSEPCLVAPPFVWKNAPDLYSRCEKRSQ